MLLRLPPFAGRGDPVPLSVIDAGGTASLTGVLGKHLGTEFAGVFLIYPYIYPAAVHIGYTLMSALRNRE